LIDPAEQLAAAKFYFRQFRDEFFQLGLVKSRKVEFYGFFTHCSSAGSVGLGIFWFWVVAQRSAIEPHGASQQKHILGDPPQVDAMAGAKQPQSISRPRMTALRWRQETSNIKVRVSKAVPRRNGRWPGLNRE
jgi:hypothetical protein